MKNMREHFIERDILLLKTVGKKPSVGENFFKKIDTTEVPLREP